MSSKVVAGNEERAQTLVGCILVHLRKLVIKERANKVGEKAY